MNQGLRSLGVINVPATWWWTHNKSVLELSGSKGFLHVLTEIQRILEKFLVLSNKKETTLSLSSGYINVDSLSGSRCL